MEGLKKMTDKLKKINQALVAYKENAPFYKKILKNVAEQGCLSIEEFEKIPMTTASDVKRAYPFGMLACDKSEVVGLYEAMDLNDANLTRSSRSCGVFTKKDMMKDISRRSYLELTKEDMVYLAIPFSYSVAARHIEKMAYDAGAMVVTADADCVNNSIRKQIDTILRLNPSVIVIPNAFLYLAVMKMMGIKADKLSNLKAILLTGTPVSNAGVERVKAEFPGVNVYVSYSRVEFGEIGYSVNSNRLQIHDEYYVELINPKTKQVITDTGVGGEIVITSLASEAMPLVRYRTGEIGKYINKNENEIEMEYVGDFDNLMEFANEGKRYTACNFEEVLFANQNVTGLYSFEFLDDDGIQITLDIDDSNKKEEVETALKQEILAVMGVDVTINAVYLGEARKDLLQPYTEKTVLDVQVVKNKRKKWLVTY